ncbi:hypothetical protein LguiA_007635 [Lonicera macranthoides]
MKLENTTPKQIHSSTLHSLALFSIIFLLCQRGSTSAHLSNQTDQLALLEFKYQIANNPVFNSWNTSLHFCQWKGVECGHRHRRVIGLNLTDQNMLGTISPHIGNLSFLRFIKLQDNNFHGEIPQQIGYLYRLRRLDLSNNTLGGPIPVNLSRCFNSRERFNIANNLLGNNATHDLSFITSLSNCTNLQGLGLDDNNFGSEIPSSIGNLSAQLNRLFLGGPIPSSLGKLRNLQLLELRGNKLRGQIPSSLANITLLYALDLSSNKLEGNIPASIGNYEKLNLLDLSHNNLIGPIPNNVVSMVSLSTVLNLSRNSLTGSLPVEVGRLKNINVLDVSNNKFTGSIPETIAACLSLEYLYIQGNFFQGIIPSALAALKGIRQLDLSRNNLSGEIPEDMEKLPYLEYLNLSFNELEGEVPKKGAFGNAKALSILGNSKLCGGIEELKLPSCRIKVKKPRRHLAFKVVIIASGAALLFVLIIISIFLRSRRRRKARKDPASLDSTLKRILRISYHELYRATAGFSPQNLIGSGSFGSVYKGKLNPREEKLVAVKVLSLQKNGASKSFVTECRALRNIRHRNLVKILTYCSSIDFKGNEFKAIVYEFMANGSLDMWLHPQVVGSSTALSLIQRLNLAIDVASAIHYLHDFCEPPIIHCDLKPSNILLDDDLTAHIGDFGLARLLSNSADTFAQAQSSSMGINGSIGYAAPEYGMGGAASKCGDVYSYGVLLLEMFTGRRPTDDMFKDGLNLHNYIKMALQEQGMQIVDQTLLAIGEAGETEAAIVYEEREVVNEIEVRSYEQYTINTGTLFHGSEKLQKCIIAVLEIGLACSVESSKQRMVMNDILRELHQIKTAFLGEGISINRTRKRKATTIAATEFDICKVKTKAQTVVEEREEESIVPP